MFLTTPIFIIILLLKEIRNNIVVMENKKCKMCNISDLLLDEDYPICYRCYIYYKANNPKVLKDLEEGSIMKVEKNKNSCGGFKNIKENII